ncbi:MAG: NAD+ synthase [Gemmatimonadaceae bacterium]|nr:NAD+ synthase [Gemmatimonadaceae bacterium]
MPRLHLAIAQFRPTKGDTTANLDRIGAILSQVAALEPRPQLVQFAESATSGYFLEGGVRECAMTADALALALAARWDAVAQPGTLLDVMIGFYEQHDGNLFNSAMYLTLAAGDGPIIQHVHRKVFLPTYSLFDEERFVERGYEVRAFDTAWGARVAMLVCEDAWHSLTGTIAALDGAQIVFVSSAAPARGAQPNAANTGEPTSVARWERLIRDLAEEHGVYCTLANLVGSEGGKHFQGASLVAGPRGDLRARAPIWDESLLLATLDLDDVARTRADLPMLSDLRVMLPHLTAELDRATHRERDDTFPRELASAAHASEDDPLSIYSLGGAQRGASAALPVLDARVSSESGPPSLAIDAALLERWLVTFLRDEFARRGFTRAVVGLSGGVDSAVTTALAVRALGAEQVTAIRLPYRTSSADSLAHAQLVIDQLGVAARTIEITAAVDGYLSQEPDADAARRGNVMARQRMIALFDQSAKLHALPLGTGNKSERLLGYFTWHADDSPPINPLGDLYKTQIWALARHLGLPAAIIEKPASADLVEGQTDEKDFGVTYAKADAILDLLIHGYRVDEVEARGFSAAEIAAVKRRLESTHWKRRLPTVAMVSGAAIGEAYMRPVDA